mgnify:CR=1 FL=1
MGDLFALELVDIFLNTEYEGGRQTALAIHELETAIDALGGLDKGE